MITNARNVTAMQHCTGTGPRKRDYTLFLDLASSLPLNHFLFYALLRFYFVLHRLLALGRIRCTAFAYPYL